MKVDGPHLLYKLINQTGTLMEVPTIIKFVPCLVRFDPRWLPILKVAFLLTLQSFFLETIWRCFIKLQFSLRKF